MGESRIARWLNQKGYEVFPAYEIELDHGKGPRLFCSDGLRLILPDLLAFNAKSARWIEAKTKSAFTWHRLSRSWQTGIDRRHWRDYLEVAKKTPFEIWILFLHKPNQSAKDTPPGLVSPSGLFGNTIEKLNANIDHEHENHGPSGMVYWQSNTLRLIAKYTELPPD